MAALTKKSVEGAWNLHELRQYQSSESYSRGAHPDGERREDPRRSELAGGVLDASADGRWTITAGGEPRAQGTWAVKKGKLELAEDPNFTSGYARLYQSRVDKNSFAVAFELIPDAHDGLDVLELTFRREPLPEALDANNGLRLIAAGLTYEQREDLSRLEPAEMQRLVRSAWDGWMNGTFAHDRSAATYRDQTDVLDNWTVEPNIQSGAFRHEHALHALRTLDEEGRWLLGNAVRRGIVALPPDPAGDAEIARAITSEWLKHFAYDRSYGGAAPESVWQSPRFPSPALDDECRTRFLEPGFAFGNRAVMETLFREPALRARAAVHRKSVVWTEVESAVRAHPEVAREEAHAFLAMPAEKRRTIQGANTAWQNAQFFAVVCREDPGALPQLVSDALEQKITTREGSIDDAAKAYARASIASLSEADRTKVAQALGL